MDITRTGCKQDWTMYWCKSISFCCKGGVINISEARLSRLWWIDIPTIADAISGQRFPTSPTSYLPIP